MRPRLLRNSIAWVTFSLEAADLLPSAKLLPSKSGWQQPSEILPSSGTKNSSAPSLHPCNQVFREHLCDVMSPFLSASSGQPSVKINIQQVSYECCRHTVGVSIQPGMKILYLLTFTFALTGWAYQPLQRLRQLGTLNWEPYNAKRNQLQTWL